MRIKLDNWIESLSWDWCISRKRYFGIPIPVWISKREGEKGKVLLPQIKDLPIDPIKSLPKGYSRDEVESEKCVLDTWATSCLSPQINARGILPKDSSLFDIIFPADLRPQGHEILRTWACGTLLMSYFHTQKLPWANIMINGWCLDKNKEKMSKSKGNAVSPETLLEKYGADVLRYWCCSARPGADILFSEDVMIEGKKIINKIYNAAKFCLIHCSKI